MASTLDAGRSSSGGLGGLQTDLSLPASSSKPASEAMHQFPGNDTQLSLGSPSRSVPDERDSLSEFHHCLNALSSNEMASGGSDSAIDTIPLVSSASAELDVSDILGNPQLDEADVSPSDAVVPTPIGDEKDDSLSFFGLADSISGPLNDESLSQPCSPSSQRTPPRSAESPEMEEIRNQILHVEKEIAEQKRLLSKAQGGNYGQCPLNANPQDNRNQELKMRPPATLKEAFARHRTPLPHEHTFMSQFWTHVETAALENSLRTTYPSDRFCPIQRAFLAAQHLHAKSSIDVGKRLWLMANAPRAAPASNSSKRPKQTAGQTVHSRQGVDAALSSLAAASAGSREECVKTLLDRNEKLLAIINDNISKMKFADNRSLMDVFVQNVSTAKQLMSAVKPEGFFMPQLKNVEIATYMLHDYAKDALPSVLLSPVGRSAPAVAQAMQHRVAHQHQQLLKHQRLLQAQHIRQQQHLQMKKRQQKGVPALNKQSVAQLHLEKQLRASQAAAMGSQQLFHLQPPQLERVTPHSFSSQKPLS